MWNISIFYLPCCLTQVMLTVLQRAMSVETFTELILLTTRVSAHWVTVECAFQSEPGRESSPGSSAVSAPSLIYNKPTSHSNNFIPYLQNKMRVCDDVMMYSMFFFCITDCVWIPAYKEVSRFDLTFTLFPFYPCSSQSNFKLQNLYFLNILQLSKTRPRPFA